MPENILCYVEEGKAGRSRSNTNKGAMLGLSGRGTSCAAVRIEKPLRVTSANNNDLFVEL